MMSLPLFFHMIRHASLAADTAADAADDFRHTAAALPAPLMMLLIRSMPAFQRALDADCRAAADAMRYHIFDYATTLIRC